MKCISFIQHAWRNFSASCSVTRSNSTLSVPTPVRIHSPACVTLQQGAAVVAAPTTFERLRAVASQLRAGLALVTLWPFAPPVFQSASSLLRTLLTSRSLAWSKSPRVRTWTIDPCRRALPQGSFGDGWISRSLARLSPTCGLTARFCSYGRILVPPSFSFASRRPPWGYLRWGSRLPVSSLQMTSTMPMPGTLGCASRTRRRHSLVTRRVHI